MGKILLSLSIVMLIMTVAFTGCAKQQAATTTPETNTVNQAAGQDQATSDVASSINDAGNLTTLDDNSLDTNLGSADKTLASW